MPDAQRPTVNAMTGFSTERWERVKDASRRWWAGELDRPLIQVRVHGCDPGRPEPTLPALSYSALYDPSVPAEAIVDRWDYELCLTRFLGDAFPQVHPNFGAGVLAAFLGARTQDASGTVWFHPPKAQAIADIHFRLDPANPCYRRVREICHAATRRWQGSVQVAMTDLGGNLDILSTFRPGEELLLDLYDHPDEVKRLTWEAHAAWWRAFEELTEVMDLPNPGYSAWTPLFSETPYYMLQCDFCYMLGPDMFREFALPELAASCRGLDNAFYHLDGPGQIAHLDALLAVPELKGIQYVPTVSQRDGAEYPELHRRIVQAGKRLQVFAHYSPRLGLALLDTLVEQLGTPRGIAFIVDVGAAQEPEARALLRKYKAE